MLKLNLFIFILCAFVIQLQAQTFKAGLVFGVTASQINGDDSAGFNKPGLEGGLKSLVSLTEKSDISLEILYSQRGAKEEARPGDVQSIYRIDYVTVPIVYSYKDWKAEDYYRVNFHGGLSYGRLINAELDNEADNTAFVDAWRTNDLSILVGATYFINKNFGLTFRYNRSLILLYRNDPNETAFPGTRSLLPFNLAFQGTYIF